MIRNFTLSFAELLQRTGAEPPRSGRGKWRCGHCEGKSATLAVHEGRELAFCHRCHWKASQRSLELGLGIESRKSTPAEVRKRRVIRRAAEDFENWARQKRIATAALLRDLDRYELLWREFGQQQLVAGEPVGEEVFEKLQTLNAWQWRIEERWQRLLDFEANAGELYHEYLRAREAA